MTMKAFVKAKIQVVHTKIHPLPPPPLFEDKLEYH